MPRFPTHSPASLRMCGQPEAVDRPASPQLLRTGLITETESEIETGTRCGFGSGTGSGGDSDPGSGSGSGRYADSSDCTARLFATTCSSEWAASDWSPVGRGGWRTSHGN